MLRFQKQFIFSLHINEDCSRTQHNPTRDNCRLYPFQRDSTSVNTGDSDEESEERKEADLSKLSSLLYHLHLTLGDYQMPENMIEATNIILNYGLDSFHYTKEDYDLMDE